MTQAGGGGSVHGPALAVVQNFMTQYDLPEVRVAVVPDERPAAPGAPPDVSVITPFSEYAAHGGGYWVVRKQGDAFTVDTDAFAARSLNDVLDHSQSVQRSASSFAVEMGGGAYDHVNNFFFLSSTDTIATLPYSLDATVAHELGHVRQALDGITESNTSLAVREFHNILVHENPKTGGSRFSYSQKKGSKPAFNLMLGRRETAVVGLDELKTYFTEHGDDGWVREKDLEVLLLVEEQLATPQYSGDRDTIVTNLVGEYLADWVGGLRVADGPRVAAQRRRHADSAGREAWSEARDGKPMPAFVRTGEKKDPGLTYPRHFDVHKYADKAFVDRIRGPIESMLGATVAERLDAVTFASYDEAQGPDAAEMVDLRVSGNPGKTIENRVFIDVRADDYWINKGYGTAEGTSVVDVDKVVATLVHEVMHAVSWPGGAAAGGLQGLDMMVGGYSIDETVTDMLSFQVYGSAFPDRPYKTGYGVIAEKSSWTPGLWQGQAIDVLEEHGFGLRRLTSVYTHMGDRPAENLNRLRAELDAKLPTVLEHWKEQIAVQSFRVARSLDATADAQKYMGAIYASLAGDASVTDPAAVAAQRELYALGATTTGATALNVKRDKWNGDTKAAALRGDRGRRARTEVVAREAAAAAAARPAVATPATFGAPPSDRPAVGTVGNLIARFGGAGNGSS